MEMLVLELNSWATHEMGKFLRDRATFVSGAYEVKRKKLMGWVKCVKESIRQGNDWTCAIVHNIFMKKSALKVLNFNLKTTIN